MLVFVAATIGMCAFLITWAIGLNADVGAIIAVAFLGLGILGQMSSRRSSQEQGS